MTTRQRPMFHSGFLDLVDLFSHRTSTSQHIQPASPVRQPEVHSDLIQSVAGHGGRDEQVKKQDDEPGQARGAGPARGAGSSGAEEALRAAAGTPMPMADGKGAMAVVNGATGSGSGSGMSAEGGAAGAVGVNNDKRRISRVPVPLPLPAPPISHRQFVPPQVSRGKGSGQAGLRYRKINKRDISYPTHFR